MSRGDRKAVRAGVLHARCGIEVPMMRSRFMSTGVVWAKNDVCRGTTRLSKRSVELENTAVSEVDRYSRRRAVRRVRRRR